MQKHHRFMNYLFNNLRLAPHENCPYSELFWSAFSRIRTEYGEIRSISSNSVQMWENADQNNSEYGYFLRSVVDRSSIATISPSEI